MNEHCLCQTLIRMIIEYAANKSHEEQVRFCGPMMPNEGEQQTTMISFGRVHHNEEIYHPSVFLIVFGH